MGSGHRGPARLRLATGLAAAAAAALLVAIVWTAAPEPPGRDAAPDVVRVGVIEGQSVPAYLDASRAELDQLRTAGAVPTETWALVSLTGYLPPGMLASVLGGTTVAEVYVRAQVDADPPFSSERTPVVRMAAVQVPGDVVTGMRATAGIRDRERADYAKLSAALTGSDPARQRLRQAYAEAAEVARAEATAYRRLCPCVFAAVVRGAPTVLEQVAGRAGVRVVDPAPEVRAPADAEFRPPLPEQTGTVPVETRPTGLGAPSGGRIVAPETPPALPSSLGAVVTSASPEDPVVGSCPSAPASEDRAAVASAPARGPGSRVPGVVAGPSRSPFRR